MPVRPELNELKMHAPYRSFRKTKDGVVGLDTEGLTTGYAFLICDYPLGNNKWIHSADDVLAYLTNDAYNNSFNTFWNADYDITVLLKWFGEAFCRQLIKSSEHTVTYKGVTFKYIPKHFLSVHVGKFTNTFYDACQYYIPRSLDGASKVYLGEGKIDIGRSKEFHQDDYDKPDLMKYCVDDARKCCLLTRKLISDLHDMGFSPNTLSSPGTIMEEAIVGSVHLPDITKIPQGALEYAYNAYKGGWIECFKKGHFSTLYDYDISSAYPYQVSELISLEGGEWFFKKGHISSKEFTLGWVNGRADITSVVSPILYRGDVNYSSMGNFGTQVFEEEARFVAPHHVGSFNTIDGWYFRAAEDAVKPFRYEMRRLFRQKRAIQNAWLPKSMSVSIYGKFAQKNVETGETGNLFNPIYASVITARTRLAIARYALGWYIDFSTGKEVQFWSQKKAMDALCIISTDGITFDKKLPSEVLGKGLGDLQLKYENEGVVIGTNVYTIKGKDPGGEWRPGRYDWLHRLAKEPEKDKYELNYFRYTTMAEGIDTGFDKIGVFSTFPYTFNINYDHKRCFQPIHTGGDLMNGQFTSIPWPVDVVQHRKGLWELMETVR